MKGILIYCLIFNLVLSGCADDDDAGLFNCPFSSNPSPNFINMVIDSPPKYPCDFVKARKNGMPWKAHAASSFTNENDTLNIVAYVNEETLGIRFLFTGTGTYKILPAGGDSYFNDNGYFYVTVGRDVIIDHYTLAEEGHLEIVEYDEAQQVIKGVFSLPMIQRSTSGTPKTLLFTQGSFSVHLPD